MTSKENNAAFAVIIATIRLDQTFSRHFFAILSQDAMDAAKQHVESHRG
jgi:hypothetical protein